MRKHTKKSLSLSTQTLRSLTDEAIAPIAGGNVSNTCSLIWNCLKPNPTLVNCF